MKVNPRNTLLALFLPLLTAGCSNAVDEEEICTPKAVVVANSIVSVGNLSWGTYEHTIGITVLGDDTYQNQKYVGINLTAPDFYTYTPAEGVSPYYFKNTTDTKTFVAYYYSDSYTSDNTIPVIAGDQITYKWAIAKDVSYANPVANFTFTCRMAWLIINVVLDETSLGKGVKATWEITNLYPRGTLSVTDGKVTPCDYTIHYAFKSGQNFSVIPRSEGTEVVVYVGDTSYKTTLPELEANTLYEFTLTVKNDGLSVKSKIKKWETVEVSVTAEKVLGADSSGD
jgi:hypothetical protein